MLCFIWINWEMSHIWCAPTDLSYFYHNTDMRIPKWSHVQNNLFKVLFYFVKSRTRSLSGMTYWRLYWQRNRWKVRSFARHWHYIWVSSMLRDCITAPLPTEKRSAESLGAFHRSDVNGHKLYEHIMDCRMLLLGRANMKIVRSEEILELIMKMRMSSPIFALLFR